MDDLEHWLEEECFTPSGPYLRPFAPNKNWRSARVFVVGTNPVTPMRNEFDSYEAYWDALTNQEEKFHEVYSLIHSGKESKTTKYRRLLTNCLKQTNVLVTNVSWFPVSEAKYVSRKEFKLGYERLHRLINGIQPEIVFVYGTKAHDFAEKTFDDVPYPYTAPKEQGAAQSNPMVLAYPHLSGRGLKKGSAFTPDVDLPKFAEIILARLRCS